MATDALDLPWSVTYHDGSGNGYRVWQESDTEEAHFSYSPVTPERSSSGVYSGGEPTEGPVETERVAELWRWVAKLEADTSLHASSRMMGTGTFNVTTASGTRRYIVKNTPLLREFNAFLAQLRDA